MHHARLVARIGAIALLAGCATTAPVPEQAPNQAALQQAVRTLDAGWTRQTRLSGVAYPILVSKADLCGKRVVNDLGFDWITLNDVEDRTLRAAADMLLGVSTLPYVAGVVPGSAAHRAGMRRGDTLLSINGAKIREDAGWSSAATVYTRKRGLNVSLVADSDKRSWKPRRLALR